MGKDEKTGIEFDEELDLTGLFCPEPLFEVRNYGETASVGHCFKVLADDPAADEDLHRWAKKSGVEILNFREEDGVLTFLFKKNKE